jgi:hypothetical protein
LAELYDQASASMSAGAWADTVQLLEILLAFDSHYRDAPAMLARARTLQELADLYEKGSRAMSAGAWVDATQHFVALLARDPDHPSAKAMLSRARRQKELADLYDAASKAVLARAWRNAIGHLDALQILDPDYRDAPEMLRRARSHVAPLRLPWLIGIFVVIIGLSAVGLFRPFDARSLYTLLTPSYGNLVLITIPILAAILATHRNVGLPIATGLLVGGSAVVIVRVVLRWRFVERYPGLLLLLSAASVSVALALVIVFRDTDLRRLPRMDLHRGKLAALFIGLTGLAIFWTQPRLLPVLRWEGMFLAAISLTPVLALTKAQRIAVVATAATLVVVWAPVALRDRDSTAAIGMTALVLILLANICAAWQSKTAQKV